MSAKAEAKATVRRNGRRESRQQRGSGRGTAERVGARKTSSRSGSSPCKSATYEFHRVVAKRRSSQSAQAQIHFIGNALTALSRPPKSFLGRTGRDVIAPPQGDGRAERGSPTCSGSHRPRRRVGPTTRPFRPLPLHTAQRVTSGVASRIGPAPSLRVTPTDGDGDRVRQPGAALARLASRAAAPAHPNDRGADHVQTPQRSGTGRRPKSRAQRCLRLAEHPLA